MSRRSVDFVYRDIGVHMALNDNGYVYSFVLRGQTYVGEPERHIWQAEQVAKNHVDELFGFGAGVEREVIFIDAGVEGD